MKSIAWTKYGKPKVLKLIDAKIPEPKDNEIQIKIIATSVTAGDCEMRSLSFSLILKLALRVMFGIFKPRNKVLGQEFSGIVEKVGSSVSQFNVGDEIFGTTGFSFGTYRAYTCMPEKPSTGSITLKPKNMTFEEAAGIAVGGLEAIHFLSNTNIQENQKVLINGAAGCIGTSVIQIVKQYGAEVYAVDRGDKLDFLKTVGADHVIDYTKTDFTTMNSKFDIIFDVVGKSHFKRSINVLTKKGIYIIANPSSMQKRKGRAINRSSHKQVRYNSANQSLEELTYLKQLVEEGHVKSFIDKTMTLEEIVEAHKYVEAGHKKGNLIIKVANK